jgi:hypothetical protein
MLAKCLFRREFTYTAVRLAVVIIVWFFWLRSPLAPDYVTAPAHHNASAEQNVMSLKHSLTKEHEKGV